MKRLVVVENTARWPFEIPGVAVVSARSYLTEQRFLDLRRATVFNLCRQYGYQSLGYYVSLLAAARGHKPLPSVETLQAVRSPALLRLVSEDLDEIIQHDFAPLITTKFSLSIYFGRNLAKRYNRLSQALYNQFPAPLLRAQFSRTDSWRLQSIRPIPTTEIPDSHRDFVIHRATEYFRRPLRPPSAKRTYRYDLAILWNEDQQFISSDEGAIKKFVSAARKLDMDATIIGRDDYGAVAEFDALFIRETTFVDHYTYRFAQRAASEGLVVIDDPISIIRCTNKVFQAELFARHAISCPKTLVVHEGNAGEVAKVIGFPCVLKRPDSSFSHGVIKVESEAALDESLEEFFEASDLVVAQEYTPSAFDWRIGVLDRKALYACKYFMARGHWQIYARSGSESRAGKWETLALEHAPPEVVALAVRSASLFGSGFYGVDIKDVDGRYLVMEVNDNPSVEAGCEDTVIKDELYLSVMRYFRERLDSRGGIAS